jgi:hypothetical protein
MRDLLAGAAVALALAGCGSAGAGPGSSPSPSPSPSGEPPVATTPAPGFDVLITDLDRDVTLHAGQKIEVFLRASPGMSLWANIRSADSSVLAAVPTGILAPRGVTVAGFQAVGVGTTTITAYAAPVCGPGVACPAYAILFSVRVTVLTA